MYEALRRNALRDKSWDVDAILTAETLLFLPTESIRSVLDYGAGNSPYRRFIRCDRYVSADVTQNLAGSIEHLITIDQPLPEPDGSFDLVLLMDVLEHLPDPRSTIAELRRLLRPGGRLIVSVPFIYREHESPQDYARYTAFGVRRLFAAQGGEVLRLTKIGNIWFTLFTLFIERGIFEGERVSLTFFGKMVNKLTRMVYPFLRPMLSGKVPEDASIYHHLLLEVRFGGE